MKIAALICRLLLGFAFLVFGLNGFLHLIPLPPPTNPLAGQFLGALGASGYMVPVFLFQLIPGILLLINRFVPLALVLLGPVLVNIVLFHGFMAPEGLPLPLILAALFAVVTLWHRDAFAGLFRPRVSGPVGPGL